MKKIPNPHDRFFKELMSRKENACDFLKNYLPVEILKLIDSEGIEIGEEEIKEALKKTIGEGGEHIMPTLAEKWYCEGEERGEEKGIHKAIVKLYKKANMQAENIAYALDLEISFVRNALKEEGIYS